MQPCCCEQEYSKGEGEQQAAADLLNKVIIVADKSPCEPCEPCERRYDPEQVFDRRDQLERTVHDDVHQHMYMHMCSNLPNLADKTSSNLETSILPHFGVTRGHTGGYQSWNGEC